MGKIEIENNVKKIEEAITISYEISCPLSTGSTRGKVPWWSKTLSILRKKVRRQFNRAKASRNEIEKITEWEIWGQCQKEYKLALKKSKKDAWKKLCTEVGGISSAARLNKVLAKDPYNQPSVFKLASGEYTKSEEEAAKHLLQVHFPDCEIVKESEINNIINNFSKPTEEGWHLANTVVCEEKVRWAINSFAPLKTPGMDNIRPIHLQQGLDVLVIPICNIFKVCIATGYIPSSWRRVKVVFIPKPGRQCYAEAKSFRPISLISFLLKALERLVEVYFKTLLKNKMSLHDFQYAYQKGRSTETAIHHLISRIERALFHRDFALGTFIDIEGAFDNTSFNSVTKALDKRGVDKNLIRWIDNMLRSRIIHTKAGSNEVSVSVKKGCPQGGVLSPQLWCLVVDDLIKILNDAGIYTQGYADDIVVLITGKHINTLGELMQSALNQISKWCSKNGLSVNPSKTTSVLFTNKRKISYFKMPSLNDTQLLLSPEVKYLGLIIDSKLSWRNHLENKLHKAKIAFMQCRRTFGRSWGLSPKIVYWLYTAIIRPMLCYGSIVWWPRVKLRKTKENLTTLQRMACVGITGSMRTTPTAALEALLNIPPLDLFVMANAEACAVRLNKTGQWYKYDTPTGHTSIWHTLEKTYEEIGMPTDYMIPFHSFGKQYEVKFPKISDWIGDSKTLPLEGDYWYTDGSLCDSNAGAGIFNDSFKKELSCSLGKYATVFQTEIAAINICATLVYTLGVSGRDICICSDAQSALKALNAVCINSKQLQECKQNLNEIARMNRVKLMWVPGHSGIPGNERADELARVGAQIEHVGPEPYAAVSDSYFKKKINSHLKTLHQDRWSSRDDCRQSKACGIKPNASIAKTLLTLNRLKLRHVVGVLTGHCCLNYHLNKLKIKDDSVCEKCYEDEETAEHFLCSCPVYANLRRKFLGNYNLHLEQIRNVSINNLCSFISGSKRFSN